MPKFFPGLLGFRVTRGDPVKVVQMIEPGDDPTVELSFKGILLTQSINLRSKQVTDYEYSSIEGKLAEGTELRYTRLVKRDGVLTSTETGIAHIGERSTRLVGACEVEVIAIDSEVRSDKDPVRAMRMLYAPGLGYFVISDSSGLPLATAYSATSLELAP
jgi:hypothetical protein